MLSKARNLQGRLANNGDYAKLVLYREGCVRGLSPLRQHRDLVLVGHCVHEVLGNPLRCTAAVGARVNNQVALLDGHLFGLDYVLLPAVSTAELVQTMWLELLRLRPAASEELKSGFVNSTSA